MLFIDLAFGKRKELDQSRKIGFCNWGGGVYVIGSFQPLTLMSCLFCMLKAEKDKGQKLTDVA